MGNQSMRGRNNGNYMTGSGRNYYDQTLPSSYSNQSQQYYHHNSQIPPLPLNMGLSYHNNRQQLSSGSRQRLNSNRSNNSRNGKNLTSTTSNSSYDINPTLAENRPRLQLLPRSQKPSSSTEDKQPIGSSTRNSSIFGSGKPRDERDPRLVELEKHIEQIVEKEQHLPLNELTIGVTKPVRILTAKSESSIDH